MVRMETTTIDTCHDPLKRAEWITVWNLYHNNKRKDMQHAYETKSKNSLINQREFNNVQKNY